MPGRLSSGRFRRLFARLFCGLLKICNLCVLVVALCLKHPQTPLSILPRRLPPASLPFCFRRIPARLPKPSSTLSGRASPLHAVFLPGNSSLFCRCAPVSVLSLSSSRWDDPVPWAVRNSPHGSYASSRLAAFSPEVSSLCRVFFRVREPFVGFPLFLKTVLSVRPS